MVVNRDIIELIILEVATFEETRIKLPGATTKIIDPIEYPDIAHLID